MLSLMAGCSGAVGAVSADSGADTEVADASPQPMHDAGPMPVTMDSSIDSAPQPGPCGVAYLGDPNAPIAFEISALPDYQTEAVLSDGADAPMLVPQQMGRVLFVGVRATNLDPCALSLSAAVRDTPSHAVSVDMRTVNLAARGDGWGTVGTPSGGAGNSASYANVATCPNQWSSRDLYGQTYGLEVTITDRLGKTATRSIQVVPRCAGADTPWQPCTCICRVGYHLGQSCADAGSD